MLCRADVNIGTFFVLYHLVMTNIAMENGPFIDGLPGFTY